MPPVPSLDRPFPQASILGLINHYFKSVDELVARMIARRSIDDVTGCWCWEGSRDGFGYGMIRGSHGRLDMKTFRVHRLAAMLWRGYDPSSRLSVLHTCDNPPCFAPEHLFIGSRADNNRDRDAKGRHISLCGSQHGCAKLNEDAVLESRRLRLQGATTRVLADRYGVSYYTMWDALTGRSWRHLPEEGRRAAGADPESG